MTLKMKQLLGVDSGRAVSSVVEHFLDTEGVRGSNPLSRTIFPKENEQLGLTDTVLTQQPPESSKPDVKWPKKVKHRNKVLAKIYRPCAGHASYRVAWSVNGKRQMKPFPTYGGKGGALEFAEDLVPKLYKGSQETALTPVQASDALAALARLQSFYEATGRRVSLLGGISEYCEALTNLSGRTLGEAVQGYLSTVAVVKRQPLAEAVAEFLAGRKPLAESKDGKRPKHSPVYEYHVNFWLNEFAGTFPNDAVCDLTKSHLDTYLGRFSELSAKSRNDRRAVVKMFLRWCVAKDYLSQHHRLFEAVAFKAESADAQEIDFYRPKELRAMLEAADAKMMPVIALSGLAGLRIEECLRLDWADVWRVDGKVEISARIAKGRQRRLVTICPALARWLEPFRDCKGPVCNKNPMQFNRAFVRLRDNLEIPARRNGLRHGFVTFHMATYANENLTAAEAGNSPQMIHQHYRGLMTKKDGEAWFAVAPAQAANIIPMAARADE